MKDKAKERRRKYERMNYDDRVEWGRWEWRGERVRKGDL